MSIDEKFDAVKSLLDAHNDSFGQVDPDKDPRIVVPQVIARIKASGGTTEDRLKGMSYEDILECLPAFDGVKPRPLAKEIAKIFRDGAATDDGKRPVTSKKADRMTPRELVEAYDPDEPDNAVGSRLSRISRGERFVVFSYGRTVDIDSTVKLLIEVKQGFEGRETCDVGGDVKAVYKVGDVPDAHADENPLYPGRPLRPDGTCDQTGRSWEGIPISVRQFIRVAIDLDDIEVTLERAHILIDMAVGSEAIKKLRERYRKAAIEFDRLAGTGSLPVLKVELARDKKGGLALSGQRPF